ncbi:ACT domain-containing protein [Candidatus Stoquefichus massiliensis]|uniref:ACT domain-containing protein n=1 Tax=Candidatus Stoquefichus massiliensis TaxID=1470350 RepID=UPI00048067E5|nr:ACT domain-containing protein [Candidatus Stoquefichus massiliensis]
MERNLVTHVECNNQIIQVKLLNVEKNSLFVSNIFKEISKMGVNIDMISQVMLEDEMRIDFTCNQEDQEKLNLALENVKKIHPRIMIYQNRNVAKIMVEGEGMKDEVGVAAQIFEILGKQQIPFMQVTTSEISISYVIPKELLDLAVSKIKETYQL